MGIGQLPDNAHNKSVRSADLDVLLHEFADIFSTDIPMVKQVVTVHLKPNARSIFQRA